jgi:hypothetical protein
MSLSLTAASELVDKEPSVALHSLFTINLISAQILTQQRIIKQPEDE